MSRDGIEIHFDEKRGSLELACEPDAFAEYRSLACRHLEGFPEIDVGKVLEMHILDTATFVARRTRPRKRVGDLILCVAIATVLALAVVGAFSLITKIAA